MSVSRGVRAVAALGVLGALGALGVGGVACGGTAARVSGRWVLVAGAPVAVGQADMPANGAPLSLVPGSPAAGQCLPPDELDGYFGPTCPHEPEGTAPGGEAYVRWYCGGALAVRVVLARCQDGRRVRVEQLAVSTVQVR